MSSTFTTPVARMVGGDCWRGDTKNFDGQPYGVDDEGNVIKMYYVEVAIPKTDPAWPALKATIDSEARVGHPTCFGPDGLCLNPAGFSDKIKDGDSIELDGKGKPFNIREGWAGCWILKLSTRLKAPPCKGREGNNLVDLTDPKSIKRGYYIQVYGSVAGNGKPANPGVFVNLNRIMLCGFGPEIAGGTSDEEAFGATAPELPQGASAVPVAVAGAQAPPPSAPGAQAPPAPPPAGGFMDAPPPPAAQTVASPPPPPAPVMYLVSGQPCTRESLLAQKWTEDQIAALPTA